MSKTELIDEIVAINQSAGRTFLDRFDEIALDEYLKHLLASQVVTSAGESRTYSFDVAESAIDTTTSAELQPETETQSAVAVLDAPAGGEPDSRDDFAAEAGEPDSAVETEPAVESAGTPAPICENQTHVFAVVDCTIEEDALQLPLFAARRADKPPIEPAEPIIESKISEPVAESAIADAPAAIQEQVEAPADAPAESNIQVKSPVVESLAADEDIAIPEIEDCAGESIIDEFLRSPISPEVTAILDEIKVGIGEFGPAVEAAAEAQAVPAEQTEPAELTNEEPAVSAEIPQAVLISSEQAVTLGAITLPVANPRTDDCLLLNDIIAAFERKCGIARVEEIAEEPAIAEAAPAANEIVEPAADTPVTVEETVQQIEEISAEDETPVDETVEMLDNQTLGQSEIVESAVGEVTEDSTTDVAVEQESSDEFPSAAEEAVDASDSNEVIETSDSGAGMAVAEEEPDVCLL